MEERTFSQTMSLLRKARGLSQRTAASDLKISQALLSHYENGAREPGLSFVCRACKYYGVTADYMLGLTDCPTARANVQELSAIVTSLRSITAQAEKMLEDN